MSENVKITQTKSAIGSTQRVRATLIGLGLNKVNKTIIRKDSPQLRGMISRVQHLIRVEE